MSPKPGRHSRARESNRHAPNGCSPNAPFPLAGSRTRAAPPSCARRGSRRRGPARAARRNAAHGRRGRRRAMRSRFARRSPAGWPKSWPRWARRTTRAPRSSGSCGRIAWSWRSRCRRPTWPSRARPRSSRSRFLVSPQPLELEPHHVHDSGVIDATTRALPLADGDRQSRRAAAGRAGRHRRPVHARSHGGCPLCRARRC